VFCLRQNGFGSYFLSKRREEFSSGILIFVIILMNFGYFFSLRTFFLFTSLFHPCFEPVPDGLKEYSKHTKRWGCFQAWTRLLFLRCNKKEIDFIKEHLKSLIYIYRNSV